MIKAGQAYDQRNEFEHRDNVQRDLEQKYDKRSNLTVPIGKKLSFTSAQGQVIEFGYNADGQFTISQDASTPVGIASISYVSTVESTLESSFASLETTLTAEFDTLSATVTTVASGFADLETSFAALETLVESVDPEAAAEAAAASALSASTSATAAGTSATAAQNSATSAATQASNAATSAGAASTSASNASTSASQASTSATNAGNSASSASTQATNAANSATNAANSATAASGSASTAATQATAAGNSATAAQNSATSASTQASNAATSAGAASTSAGNASTSASQASTSASNAAGSASSASTSATNAANSSTSAGNSATAASGSASTAATQATAAGNSATAASGSATSAATEASNAATSAGAASTSAGNASTSASQASTSASNAAGSASSASTSATNAANSSTSAGNSATAASTSASQASTSATNAGNSASSASTSATNAANSATAAGGSASAAATSASSASTSATNAGNSATSSQSSSVTAASSAAQTYPGSFENDGYRYFTHAVAGTPGADLSTGTTVTVSGIGQVYQVTAYTEIYGKAYIAVGSGRTHKLLSKARTSTDGSTASAQYFAFACFDSSFAYLGMYGTNNDTNRTASEGWSDDGPTLTSAQIVGVYPTAVYIRTSATFVPGTGATMQLALMRYVDASETAAAAAQAAASATSASSASTSASGAATSASAASTSATTATTQASNASTSASQASTSAGNAATSASTATTQASNAAGSASTASTQASNASASATAASNSATLSATFASGSQGSINSSATFADNANATGIPTNWANWTNGTANTTRVTGIAPQPYAVTIVGPAATNSGILQSVHSGVTSGWHVFEADITLNSGALTGAGVIVNADPAAVYTEYPLIFSTDLDTNGSAPGAGTTGTRYKFRKLVQITRGGTYTQFFAMSHYSGLGSIASANSITWHRCALRPASQAEIEARQAKNDLVTTNANVATNTSAIATETSARAAADTTLTARANTLYKASQNLLKNSTFINNGSDWLTIGSPGYFGDGDNRYIAFQATSYQRGYQDVLVEAGRRYSLSAEMYRDTSSMSCRVYVQWLDTTRTTHLGYGGIINHPSTGWVAVKADLEGVNADMIAPTNAVWARIYVDNYQPSSYPSGTSAVRRVCFNGGDYAVPWSEGPVEAALAATNATVATNTSAIATETSARAAADTTLTAQVVSLRNSAPPDRPAVADDFTTNTSNGTPATWAAISVGTVVTAANEGSVRKFTDLQTFTTRSWLPVIAGRTYRMTHRGRVTADGTDNRIIAAFIAHDKDGVASGAIDFHTADAAAVVADGWQTFTRDITATTIISAYASAAYIRPRLSVNRNSASADSGADTEVAILRIEDITEITATNANVTTNASAIATVNGAAAFWETIVSASGGDLSAVRLKAGSTGSYIELISTVLRLANVSNGAVIEVMRAISGEAFFSRPISSDSGARRVTIGPGYGVSGQEVVLWFGPVATAPSSQSRTNGYFALGTDGKVYYGSAELVGGTAPMTATITGDFLDSTRTTAKTPTIDVSPAISGITNGTSPYTYSWSLVEMRDGTAPTLTNATTSSCTLYRAATLANSASYDGTWQCLITDANGKVCVKYYKYSDFSTI